ncbi:hypothetical protein PABG_04234 [Paracoccidioides brasiliensis Pb03]|nr:hypothetical protein PABG_04234 [Paracoccidioides brasiliensis Pb03]
MYRNPKSRIPTFEMTEYYQSQPDTGPHTAWTSKAVSWNFPMFSNCGEKNMQGLTKATCHTRSNCPFRKSQAKRVRLRQVREVSLLLPFTSSLSIGGKGTIRGCGATPTFSTLIRPGSSETSHTAIKLL